MRHFAEVFQIMRTITSRRDIFDYTDITCGRRNTRQIGDGAGMRAADFGAKEPISDFDGGVLHTFSPQRVDLSAVLGASLRFKLLLAANRQCGQRGVDQIQIAALKVEA